MYVLEVFSFKSLYDAAATADTVSGNDIRFFTQVGWLGFSHYYYRARFFI